MGRQLWLDRGAVVFMLNWAESTDLDNFSALANRKGGHTEGFAYVYIYVYIHICMYINICIHVYLCMYMYTYGWLSELWSPFGVP